MGGEKQTENHNHPTLEEITNQKTPKQPRNYSGIFSKIYIAEKSDPSPLKYQMYSTESTLGGIQIGTHTYLQVSINKLV